MTPPAARAYARAIVTGRSLEAKLAPPPEELALEEPGAAAPERADAPGRPDGLAITAGRDARVPPLAGMRDPSQRARILHALANHELQAIELFAWAVLAFPDTPVAFRRGLLAILADEQRHFGLYRDRLAALGARFGDHPVTGHFWNKLDHLATPIGFVCTMCLTFENANLDFAGDYAEAARACGDAATAAAIERVHADEIRHVHFGWVWLRRFAAEAEAAGAEAAGAGEDGGAAGTDRGAVDMWQAYLRNVRPPLGPRRARGARFDREARRRAGLDEAFIDALAAVEPTRPSGQPR